MCVPPCNLSCVFDEEYCSLSGSEAVRIEMAEDLAYVPLTNDDKSRAAQTVARALIEMLGSSNPLARGAALKALYSLSSLDSNANFLIEAGVLSPLMRDLFVVGTTQVSTKQKEVSASVLANVVCSGGNWEHTPIDDSGNTLASELIVHNLLHMISNTGPAIEAKLLQVSTVSFEGTCTQSIFLRESTNICWDVEHFEF